MLKHILVASGLLAALLAKPAIAQDRTFGQLQTERLVDGIWSLRQPDRLWATVIGNVTIIDQSDGVVLFDAGGSYADGTWIADEIQRLTEKPVKVIVISHWHNDHSLGAGAIRDRWPEARVIATQQTAEAMAKVFSRVPRGHPVRRTAAQLNRIMGFALAQEALGHDASLPRYLRLLQQALGEVRRQVGPLAREELELEQIRAQLDYTDLTMRFAGDDPWARHWFETYWLYQSPKRRGAK